MSLLGDGKSLRGSYFITNLFHSYCRTNFPFCSIFPMKGSDVWDDSVSLVSHRLKTTSDGETTEIKEKERFEVWRRYSEFDSLRTFFCNIYPHVSRACNLIM